MMDEDYAPQDVACKLAESANQYIGGVSIGINAVDQLKMMHEQRIQSAIYHLTEARRVRADFQLMADIRVWVAEKRHEFMLLLDDLGGN